MPTPRRFSFLTVTWLLTAIVPSAALLAAGQGGVRGDRRQFDGFSFELPSGWFPAVPGPGTTKADILLGGIRLGAKEEIVVERRTPDVSHAGVAGGSMGEKLGR